MFGVDMFPARAGVNRPVRRIPCGKPNVPRTRGGEPFLDTLAEVAELCSPHARG